MVDDSPEALLPHQNFSVDVVLGSDESKATGSSISPNEGPLFKSDYFEENEIVIVENFKKLYPHVDFKVLWGFFGFFKTKILETTSSSLLEHY